MRTPKRTKQRMYVAMYHDGEPIYDTDDEGNIIYDTMPDGVSVPRVIGETPAGYDDPIEFWNSITGTLTDDELQALFEQEFEYQATSDQLLAIKQIK